VKIKKAIIPAAGYGTRFLPFTKAMPKEMLPLIDKPVIQFIVEELVRSGVSQIVLVTGWNKRAIEDHFDYNFELEYRLKEAGKMDSYQEIRRIADLATFIYVRQKEPLGNGHAVLCAQKLINNEPFIVSWGDDLIIGQDKPYFAQLVDVYTKYGGAVLSVNQTDEAGMKRYGIIKAKKIADRVYQVSEVIEKPGPEKAPSNLAQLGGFVLTPKIFEILKKTKPGKGGEIWLQDAINELCKTEPVYAYEFEGQRYDTGEKLGFLKSIIKMAIQREDLKKDFKRFLKDLK
jgi:UTP--glucose-1-phosphate uridylyltransferase